MVSQTNVDFPQDYGTTPLYFGQSGNPWLDGKLAGTLDEVSLYNRALSSNEILAIYDAGSSGKCLPVPVITTQPQSQSVVAGSNAVFTVVASGQTPFSYQWLLNGTNLTDNAYVNGATNATLTIGNVIGSDAGDYQVVVSNVFGSTVSSNAHLTVLFTTTLQFTDIGANLTPVDNASVAWGDYDNDGQLDLLITGSGTSYIYHNSNGVFTLSTTLQGISYGGAVWGDYNNDGRLDVLLSGTMSVPFGGNQAIWRIYRNDASNGFTQIFAANSPDVSEGERYYSLAWIDYDNDGKLDALFVGPSGALFHNNGNDSFTNSGINIEAPGFSSVACGDYDNDGNMDFVINGSGPPWWGNPTTYLYKNLGGGLIVLATNQLAGIDQGAAAWDDFNNDGNLDLIMAGATGNGAALQTVLYVGDGNGGLSNQPGSLEETIGGSVAWGDFDNDGLPDLVISTVGTLGTTKIYHNNGDGTFTDTGVSLPSCGNGGVAVGDFNNDGKLDIAIVGEGVAKIFRNDSVIPTNTPPTAPTSLSAVPTTNAMLLSWSAATDVNQNGGLSYNIRMGTTPGGIDVVGPMADPATGFRRIPAMGNAGLCLTRTVTHLHPGTYYWSVQAIDHDFAGSAFAPEQSFTITSPTLTSQPVSQTNAPGTPVSFQVAADGTLPIRYQWYFDEAPLADSGRVTGSGTTNLAITSVQVPDAGDYTLVAANVAGSVTSLVATLTVTAPPVIASQPTNVTAVAGATAAFGVLVAGTGPFTYQWQFGGTNIDNATNDILSLTNLQMSQSGTYDVAVSNIYGGVVSSNATLTVTPLAVVVQPGSQSADAGANVSFNAVVTGQGPFTYQWQFGMTNIANATNSTLTLTYLQDNQAGVYDVVVSNSFGSVTSADAELTVIPWPIIEPLRQTNLIGTTVSFTAVYGGPTPVFYQWYLNGNPLSDGGQFSGATNSSLTISSIQNFNIGSYQVAVGTGTNVLTSPMARLTVTNYGPAVRYVNLNNPNPAYPYEDWSTAATNIQDAMDAAFAGDEILVTNGIYSGGGHVVYGSPTSLFVNRAVVVQSVNGPRVTFINGGGGMRCVYLTNNATLSGFTLTNGNAGTGGGVYCESTNNDVVSNCVISACTASSQGGGAYQGDLINCTFANNLCNGSGGGAASSLLSFCKLTANSAASGGGAYSGVLNNCILIGNSSTNVAGGGGGTYNSTVFNSALANNSAAYDSQPFPQGGYGGGAYGGALVNCTVTENHAFFGGGVASCAITNCIVYYNTYFTNYYAGQAYDSNWYSVSGDHCCTVPLPTGTGNITNDPILASISHISLNSPCRAAGNPTAASGVDIDGEPWANPPSIGCDELYPSNSAGNITVTIGAAYTNAAPGFPYNFEADISGPITASTWDFGDGTVVTNEAYATHTWATVGDYPVVLTAYNDTYPNGVSATDIIHVAIPKVLYVSRYNQNPVPPYDTWAKAATTIQDAIDAASPGALILVTNGPGPLYYETNGPAIYQTGGRVIRGTLMNRVAIDKPVTVESVNGPAVTFIQGIPAINGGVRCVYMTNGATLIGFTIIEGGTAYTGDITNDDIGGGVWCESSDAVISNCIICGNVASHDGSGTFRGTFYNCTLITNSLPGGIWQNAALNSTLYNCNIISNYYEGAESCWLSNCTVAYNSGGGVGLSTVNDCTIIGNSSIGFYGGGAFGGTLTNCILAWNSANTGGGAYGQPGAPIVLDNCMIVSNTAVNGGGVYVPYSANSYTNCILNNCILASNSASSSGGGSAFAELNGCIISNNVAENAGGGVEGGLLNNCSLVGNTAGQGGGADGFYSQPVLTTLNNCVLSGNVVTNIGNIGYIHLGGGGALYCNLSRCTLSNNIILGYPYVGGGAVDSKLNGCLVINNSAPGRAGGPLGSGGGTASCALTNCVLAYNTAGTNGGGDSGSTLVNCTVVGNSAPLGGGGYNSTAKSSILYYNTGGDYYSSGNYSLNYCCTTSPTNGLNNITNAPIFVNLAGGDFHLQSQSPCINSGDNAYINSATDLDGNPRIVGGTVDIGAYEYQSPTSVISYAWLQQYGLPTDGSVDYANLDGTPFNVYQDWLAGLNPTNALSVLAMLPPVLTNNPAGLVVRWESVSNRTYFLQSSTNLASQPEFSTIQSNIVGQPDVTSFMDTNAVGNGPFFYRVGVQE